MNQATLYPNWQDIVEFGSDGPVHKALVETPGYRSVIVGMEKSQAIPPHAAKAATFHFLQGSGRLTAGGEILSVGPGTTVVVPDGVPRGIEADTRLVFLASHGSAIPTRGKPGMKVPVAVMIGALVMIGLMAGVMFGPALMMSRLGLSAAGMNGLMYLPLLGIAMMAVMMFIFYRRMSGKGGRRMRMGSVGENTPTAGSMTADFEVPDVSCAHCKMTIESAVGGLPGVASVEVDIKAKRVRVSFREPATASAIELALRESGYPATTVHQPD